TGRCGCRGAGSRSGGDARSPSGSSRTVVLVHVGEERGFGGGRVGRAFDRLLGCGCGWPGEWPAVGVPAFARAGGPAAPVVGAGGRCRGGGLRFRGPRVGAACVRLAALQALGVLVGDVEGLGERFGDALGGVLALGPEGPLIRHGLPLVLGAGDDEVAALAPPAFVPDRDEVPGGAAGTAGLLVGVHGPVRVVADAGGAEVVSHGAGPFWWRGASWGGRGAGGWRGGARSGPGGRRGCRWLLGSGGVRGGRRGVRRHRGGCDAGPSRLTLRAAASGAPFGPEQDRVEPETDRDLVGGGGADAPAAGAPEADRGPADTEPPGDLVVVGVVEQRHEGRRVVGAA